MQISGKGCLSDFVGAGNSPRRTRRSQDAGLENSSGVFGRKVHSLPTGKRTPFTQRENNFLTSDTTVRVVRPKSRKDSSTSKASFVSARNSKIDGKGAFADKRFAAGEKVGEYTGKTVLSYPCKQHPEHFYVAEIAEEGLERGNIAEKIQYQNNDTFVVWTGIDLKGTPMEFGIDGNSNLRYLNHSKEPNVKLNVDFEGATALWSEKDKVKVSVIALKNIKSGEELCFDYLHGNKKKINFGKSLVLNADDSKEARYAIESILPVTIFGKKGYLMEQNEKRKRCDIDEESTENFLKRIERAKKVAEKAGVSIDVIDADQKKSFHKSMPEKKWDRYGKLWNYISSDGDRNLNEKNKKILEELIDDINNEELELEYRLKLLHTTEYFWVADNMAGDWKTCIKPKIQVIKNTAIAAGVTEHILSVEKLADFHDENELSVTVWRLCANQWNRLRRYHQTLTDSDRKGLRDIQELVSDRSELSVVLKNKIKHTTNVFWAEAGYSVDWQLYVSSAKPELAAKPKKGVKRKRV